MAALHFELVTPSGFCFRQTWPRSPFPAPKARWEILPAHAPVLSTLRPGVITVTRETGQPERIFVRGGFAEVNAQGLTVLAETALPMAELHPRTAHLAPPYQDLEEDVADARDDETRRRAQESLEHLKALQAAL